VRGASLQNRPGRGFGGVPVPTAGVGFCGEPWSGLVAVCPSASGLTWCGVAMRGTGHRGRSNAFGLRSSCKSCPSGVLGEEWGVQSGMSLQLGFHKQRK